MQNYSLINNFVPVLICSRCYVFRIISAKNEAEFLKIAIRWYNATQITYRRMEVSLPNETKVWENFKRSNAEAYEAIYQCYYDQLYNYGRKFTSDYFLIEDSIQQLFVNLWKNKTKLATPPSVKNYLYKSFRTTLFKQLKRASHNVYYRPDAHPFMVSLSTEAQLIQSEQQAELRAWLQMAIKSLSDHQREAIFLKFYDQLSYQEISEVMQIEVRSAYDLVHKGLARLRKIRTIRSIPLISWVLLLMMMLNIWQ